MSTAGEGEMVTNHDETLWKKMWAFKDHGKIYDTVYHKEHAPGFRWLHESFDNNWRMTKFQGAADRIQLKRMPEWHKKRIDNAKQIWSYVKAIPALRVSKVPEEITHTAYKCYLFVEPAQLKETWNRNRTIVEVDTRGDAVLAQKSIEKKPLITQIVDQIHVCQ